MKAHTILLTLGLLASGFASTGCNGDESDSAGSAQSAEAPAALSISGAVTVKQNETVPIAVTASFSDGETRDVTRDAALSWIVEDTDVAVVDAEGLVRGINPGATRIYALYGETRSEPEVVAVHPEVAAVP